MLFTDGATQLYIQSPDTYVSILATSRYNKQCKNTYCITGVVIYLTPTVHTLGVTKTAAIIGINAFTGTKPDMGGFPARES